jgi:hypothetical protein
MQGIREKLQGTTVTVIAAIVAVLGIAYIIWWIFAPTLAASLSENRIYICSETGKSFSHKIQRGEAEPLMSPFSGKETAYLAELCNWTQDGKVTEKRTPVLLNDSIGKRGPTFCPDCGRFVRRFNPLAVEGATPPPTEAEMKSRRQPGG